MDVVQKPESKSKPEPKDESGAHQLPEELYKATLKNMQMIQAFKGSGGDESSLAQFKDPPSIIVLLGISFLLLGVLWLLTTLLNWFEIHNNWQKYRCMPSIMPFSKFYGYNLDDTLSFCIGEAVREHAPGVINPIYNNINTVMNTVDGIYDRAEAVEGGVMKLLSGFETFLVQFANSFRLIGSRIRMSLIRISDIFQRVYGMFTAFAFAGMSAITFGENLICNPIVTFLGTIAGVDICCFAPDTMIEMSDGSFRKIASLRIGDLLAGGARITSTYEFAGFETSMVYLNGIHVSGNHSFYLPDGSTCSASDHPLSVPAPSIERIYCIATTNHRIPVGSLTMGSLVKLVATDYEECSDPGVIEQAQKAALRSLNGSVFGSGSVSVEGQTCADYSLGLDPDALICVELKYKKLSEMSVGDPLAGGARVVGLVREWCPLCVMTPAGTVMSAAQLVYDEAQRLWVRAFTLYPAIPGGRELLHLFSSEEKSLFIFKNCEFLQVRDYMETHDYNVQKPYDEYLSSQ
jgi:hypothetical protein